MKGAIVMKAHYNNKYNQELDQIALEYGEILTDDEGYNGYMDEWGDLYDSEYFHIRIIKYDGHIYYHKMIGGKVVEFKELI